jgi:hypothetical protein
MEYHVALSFAGEDREYVDQVAGHLRRLGVNVFYDKYEQVDLWSKDLGQKRWGRKGVRNLCMIRYRR